MPGGGDNPYDPRHGRLSPHLTGSLSPDENREGESRHYGFIRDFRALEPTLHQMLALWSSRCIEGALPRTRDMGPDVLKGLVSHVAVVDVLHDPYDYRYRIVGSYIEDMIGEKRVGQRAREFMFGPMLEFTIRAVEELVRDRRPLAMWGLKMPWIERDYKRWQVLVLPLSETGETVDRAVMGFAFY